MVVLAWWGSYLGRRGGAEEGGRALKSANIVALEKTLGNSYWARELWMAWASATVIVQKESRVG